ncbi:FMNH2-utilizing oxygenase [Leucobacter sp. 7(1)]|uniref:LLM class flavin-dependent oxidoreductase n=1 Tax=Leucobacter sp. 7(1) TaxID=1255613 RepID=UPI00097EE0C0|nr:LLM class flavin-dependent oxidoreductase [Leucobacter sp. 7(1)]SJN13067.1 FMNH2-utilizing oxygenase [Leucobacter sp. 7(1)]
MSPITQPTPFSVGIALDGAGWHPAAWREPDARAEDLFTAPYWTELVQTAEAGGLDYVTIEDALSVPGTGALSSSPASPRPDRVAGRLDALLTATWAAPHTRAIGLIPTVTVTHTEPFHVATALQTLDHVSEGRGGWHLRISPEHAAAAAFGRRPAPSIETARVIAGEPDPGLDALLDEAAEAAEVARGLWASWDADAEIRDAATGRFLDRDRVHHINFVGEHFSVVGPSIVPRSPQGHLPITVLSHSPRVHELAARAADVVFITPESESVRAGASRGASVAELVAQVRAAEQTVDRQARGLAPLRIVADLVITLDADSETPGETGAARLERLNDLAGETLESDARIVAGSAAEIIELIAEWHAAGVDGVRLRPLTLPGDLGRIVEDLLPALRARGLAAAHAEAAAAPQPQALRERFGLAPVPSRTPRTEETAA